MSMTHTPGDLLRIEVILAMPLVQYRQVLDVPRGTRAREAVRLALEAGLLPPGAEPDISPMHAPLGVFAEKVDDDYCCQQGDRIEIYRPLLQDPKELRRQRARQSIS
ncbi:RnfH family protein [Granulosicoccus sp. 3-233]|uniref:RnfH family protein n=1 Tax=Granulosicoccus sp. 3-233 TaxID=3417969 RepID=UPI003D334348